AQPPYYKKLTTRWVMEAKQVSTQESRLQKLISLSEAGKRLL
ncbi:MAG: YdeI/OmpD-associated family protein, partial [Chitinophagaceae bacterium]|nr:YdeI/OmpD-associated family protein [Chitinophagaceae bacterium]